jgi:hypothetical protein
VEATVLAVPEAVHNNPPETKKIKNYLKIITVCEIDGIPNERLRHLPRTVVYLKNFINYYIRLSYVQMTEKEPSHNLIGTG